MTYDICLDKVWYYILGVKRVQMGIHGGTGCGSYDGVRIELKAKSEANRNYCRTRPYGEFSAGDTLDWTGRQLGNCQIAQFDPTEEEISLRIKTNRNDKFCPIWVKIILNDQKSTSYLLSLPDGDWHSHGDKDDIAYTAKKIGKI